MHAMGCSLSSAGVDPLKIESHRPHRDQRASTSKKSLDFYGRILGFKQLQTVDCGDFDITYFWLPSGSRLELFDYHGKNQDIRARRK